jgi:hypothetical protein
MDVIALHFIVLLLTLLLMRRSGSSSSLRVAEDLSTARLRVVAAAGAGAGGRTDRLLLPQLRFMTPKTISLIRGPGDMRNPVS